MNWETYLTRGPYVPIYHMCDEADYKRQMEENSEYYPPFYNSDGFIHATADPSQLLVVGNHFYKSDTGNWVCLELDPYFLLGTVKYEAAAPVGNIATIHKVDKNAPLFPHIYGSIPLKSVVKIHDIVRSSDGSFLSIAGVQ